MKKFYNFVLVFILNFITFSTIFALDHNPAINSKILNEIEPYLIDPHSPLKSAIDLIFTNSRVTFNPVTLVQAGFTILCHQPRSFIAVAKHPAVPGFLFKLYYDIELRMKNNTPGWKWFVRRCQSAKILRKIIEKNQLKYFAVPDKFIYILPPATAPIKTPEIDPKLTVLIVEDMNLVPEDLNYLAWRTLITPDILDELYILISYAKGSSYRPDNIPFTYSGKFAFIDTEYPNRKPDFYSILPYLSEDMRNYWMTLIKKNYLLDLLHN